MRCCPPLLNWTILSRSQEMLSGSNLEHVALTFVVPSTRTRAPRAASASAPAPSPAPAPVLCSDADPARPVSDAEAATACWTISGLFGCDVGLDRIRDERGRGSNWESPLAAVGCGCHTFNSRGPACGLMVRKTARSAGVVVMRRNSETRGVEVGYANARGWSCGSGSDAEGRRNETSDRWRASCHGGGRRGGERYRGR